MFLRSHFLTRFWSKQLCLLRNCRCFQFPFLPWKKRFFWLFPFFLSFFLHSIRDQLEGNTRGCLNGVINSRKLNHPKFWRSSIDIWQGLWENILQHISIPISHFFSPILFPECFFNFKWFLIHLLCFLAINSHTVQINWGCEKTSLQAMEQRGAGSREQSKRAGRLVVK